jgi:ABC-type transporter Mla subunit MlaD
MALQDLTPQLRTRLSRMERAVGWFVFVATALLIFGFGYYIYHTAERKGWFKIKAPFHVYLQSSAGLSVKDPVYMMGFQVGEITSVEPQQPYDPHNVIVKFEILEPYFRYIWLGGSYVKVNAAGFLNQRQLEVTRGTNGPAICVTQPGVWKTIPELEQIIVTESDRWQLYQDVLDDNSNIVFGAYTMLTQSNLETIAELKPPTNSIFVYDNKPSFNYIVASWDNRVHRYVNFAPDHDTAWLRAVETPPIGDQLQAMVAQVQSALPGILSLTNTLSAVLDNATAATSNLNTTLVAAQPMVTNFAIISGQLREPGGALNWALGTNGSGQLLDALTNVNVLLVNTDTNLNGLAASLGQTLDHLADITSNLNAQVQADTNLLGGISKTIADTDDFVQGLKRHWLLRSAFKTKATNAPANK